ncbi:MAG: nitroreductase/quinone reductase family protein [Dehalococcoidia bacterium]
MIDTALAEADYCYLTTTGRVSGKPHEIEIWFGLRGDTLYMLSGGGTRADWVRNIKKAPAVKVRIGETTFAGTARIIEGTEEDETARSLLVEKYSPGYSGDLSGWRRTALPVAVDLGG